MQNPHLSHIRLRHGTIKKVAERLGIKYQTAQQRIARRELEAMKIAAEIEREIQEQEAEIAKVFGINGTPRT